VRVILGSTSEQLGVMKLSDALRKAQSLGLDLVEVAPTANPPVCKIVDFGKFRYDISKQEKDKKTSGTKLKEIKLMEKVRDDLAGMSQVEMEPKIAGRNVTMTLSPLPAARRKRRFSVQAEDADEAAAEKSAAAVPE
jgi:translation initiation factor IF-3